jgi:hypothetical protein
MRMVLKHVFKKCYKHFSMIISCSQIEYGTVMKMSYVKL